MVNGACQIALVGGVNALLHESMFNVYCRMGMLSPTGHSKVFDNSVNGFVRGEGCGFVVLQLLEQCLYDKQVLAIIRSIATNHNGHLTHYILAPSCDSQETLLRTVLKRANISPDQINYIEAQGTGTAKAGDSNEIECIKRVFSDHSSPVNIGSVKANIRHLEGGAGIAGLIKAVLVINYRVSPGNAGLGNLFTEVGSSLSISNLNLPLFHEWELSNHFTNSFGYGGVNVSTIIQSPIKISFDGIQETLTPLNPMPLPGFYERFELCKYVTIAHPTTVYTAGSSIGDNSEDDEVDYDEFTAVCSSCNIDSRET